MRRATSVRKLVGRMVWGKTGVPKQQKTGGPKTTDMVVFMGDSGGEAKTRRFCAHPALHGFPSGLC